MGTWSRRCAAVALGILLAAGALGCTRAKKLTGEDDSVFDDVLYGVFGRDRDAEDYYRIVKQSHDAQRFGYRVTEDKFLIDKNVDAVQRLGKMEYERLAGQAQVVVLLCDVLLADPSALAQANAANSLTRLAVRSPRGDERRTPDSGSRLRALVAEMDGLHPGGARSARASVNQRTTQIVQAIGALGLPSAAVAKDALEVFTKRPYLLDTTDAGVRRAVDVALVERMQDLTRLALREAVTAESEHVREEAVRGLKTLRDEASEQVAIGRLGVEPNTRVLAEIVEYLGVSGSAASVAALLPLLEGPDPTLRHKARQSLTRIAGRDLGFRRVTWTRWALATYPELAAQRAADDPFQPGPGMR